LSGLDYSFSTFYQGKISEKLFLYSSFSHKPENELNSRNSQTIATLKADGGFGGDSESIDLQAIGLEKTKVIMPVKNTFGIGLGQDKKWFFGVSYKSVAEGGFKNRIMNLDNVSFKSSKQYSAGGFFIPKYDSFTNFLTP